jgi:hypothetical protein
MKFSLCVPLRHIKGVEVQPHSFLTSAHGGEWLTLCPDCFNLRKNTRLGGLQGQSGRFGKDKNLLPLPGFEPRTVKPVAELLHQLHYSSCSWEKEKNSSEVIN